METQDIPVFNGNNYIVAKNLPVDKSPDAKTTVEFWMYNTGTNNMPIGFDDWDIWINNGKLGINTLSGDLLGSSAPDEYRNIWTHVAVVFNNTQINSNTCKIYINGVLQEIMYYAGSASASKTVSDTFAIGGNIHHMEYGFKGSIKDVRVWNGERTGEEIAGNMNNRMAGTEERTYRILEIK